MVAIGDAITYPTESDDWIVTILIGGVLLIFSFLIVPIFLVFGYQIRVIRSRMDGEPEPPTFGDWGELLVNGLKAFVVYLVYLLVPIAVMAFTIGGAILSGGEEFAIAAFLGGILVTFAAALVFGYFAIVSILSFAHKDSIRAAFDVGTIIDIATTREFFIAWLAAVVIGIVFSIGNFFLSLIPIIGAIIGLFISFYLQIVTAYIWADGYVDATGMSRGSTTDEATI